MSADLLGGAGAESPISDTEKVKELRAEIQMRKRVYPRLVEKHTMTEQAMDRRIAILEAIIEDYEGGRLGR